MPIRLNRPVHRHTTFLFAAATLCACRIEPAAAADVSIGGGIAAANGRVDCVAAFPCDRSSTAWKVFAGWRLQGEFELQAIGFGAGRFKGGDIVPNGGPFGGSFKVDGIGLSGGYRWALAPDWQLVGRAGLASVRTRFEYADSSLGSVSKTSVQPLLGLGLVWQLTPAIGLVLQDDVTRIRAHDTHGTLQMLGVALQYAF